MVCTDIHWKANGQIEAKIKEYELALISAAGLYLEIQQLVETKNNDYNLDVAKRLTIATINFKNTVEQTGER
jgi:hypothetical protein